VLGNIRSACTPVTTLCRVAEVCGLPSAASFGLYWAKSTEMIDVACYVASIQRRGQDDEMMLCYVATAY